MLGEFHRQRSLARYNPWVHKESDRTSLFQTSGPIFWCHIFIHTHTNTHTHIYIYIHTYFLFILFMVFLGKNTRMVLLQWTTLSEVFTITYPSWAVLQSMAQCFIELHKPLCQKKAVIHEGDRFSMQIFLLNMGGLHPINQFSSVAHLCLTFCYPMDCSTTGFPVHYQLPELAQSESEK